MNAGNGISPADLAILRAAVTAYMTTPVTVETPQTSTDRYGKTITTYTTAYSTTGELSSLNGREQQLLDNLSDQGTVRSRSTKLRLPYGTVLTAGQVVQSAGERWNVTYIDTGGTLGVAVEALLTWREITNE